MTPKTQDKPKTVAVSGLFAGSPAADALKDGDVILSINDVSVSSLDSLRRVVFAADPEEPLALQVKRVGAGAGATVGGQDSVHSIGWQVAGVDA